MPDSRGSSVSFVLLAQKKPEFAAAAVAPCWRRCRRHRDREIHKYVHSGCEYIKCIAVAAVCVGASVSVPSVCVNAELMQQCFVVLCA